MKTTSPLLAGFALAIVVSACTASGGASPSPSPTVPPPSAQPSPTPQPPSTQPVPIVGSPEEAAARVIASDTRFTGIGRQDANLIGQGSWWRAEARGELFRVQVQIGWGDCPAGCINRHDWIFDVAADGTITLVEETGDPLEGASG